MAQQKAEWRTIAAWPAYEVSSLGEVRRKATGRVLIPMRTGVRRPGAQRSKVRLCSSPRADLDVAVLVLEQFVGPRPPGNVVLHQDDNSGNNALSNLSWGTSRDNARGCAAKFRNGRQLLTTHQMQEIARRREAGERGAALAAEFNISQQRVCDIFKGRCHIGELK